MNYEGLTVVVNEQGIATLTLNRPEKHNAFDEHLIASLQSALHNLQADTNVRVVVLTAAGRHFCAGADLAWMQRLAHYSPEENLADAQQLAQLLQRLNELEKPTLALVQGAVMGGGIGLIVCCDVVVAAQDAYFAFSEVKWGLIPATIAPYVIHALGMRAARRYFLTGERFSASEAQRWGLIHEQVAPTELTATGYAIARQIAQNAPQAVCAAKRLIQRCQPIDNNLPAETAQLLADIRVSAEAQQGLQAFLAKRAPQWK